MSDKKRLIKAIALGSVCGLLTSIIFMCIFAVVMLKGGLLSSDIIDYIMAGILALGAFVGGFTATKINHGAGLVAGALTGVTMIIAVCVISFFKGEADFTTLILIKLAAAVICGALGGLLGIKEKRQINI